MWVSLHNGTHTEGDATALHISRPRHRDEPTDMGTVYKRMQQPTVMCIGVWSIVHFYAFATGYVIKGEDAIDDVRVILLGSGVLRNAVC